PQLSDLRESGAIEQDADIVTFIHRPEYYGITEDNSGNSLIGVAEIIIAKHRNGATGEIYLSFRKNLAKFADMESNISNSDNFMEQTYSSKMNEDETVNIGLPGNKRFDTQEGNVSNPPF
ncbi:MAG: replicative DNA helicase, partial [Mariniphaga sp.]|nr:replicative DNA helicase [Mariniphaga sp.]